MKILKTVFIAALVMSVSQISAQTVDEIVAQNITAMGGPEKLKSLKSLRMTGTLSVSGTDINMTTTRLDQVGLRMDMEVAGTFNYQMINKNAGWVFMPVMGMTEPKKMDEAQHKSAVYQLDIQGALYNYKEKGTVIEYIGKEDVEGVPAHKLKVNFQNGHHAFFYMDPKTGMHIKSVSNVPVNGQPTEVITTFSDFKANDQGFIFPYTVTTTQGSIIYDKIETNIDVKEDLFTN